MWDKREAIHYLLNNGRFEIPEKYLLTDQRLELPVILGRCGLP
jgi:hypothetical protein